MIDTGASNRFIEMQEQINKEYFLALSDLVGADNGDVSYRLLLRDLWLTNFYSILKKDLNREDDGLILREKIMGDDSDYITGPCSLLEMLIGLAERMDEIMYDPDSGDGVSRWFWEMIENLGLDEMSDDHYNTKIVENHLRMLLERTYDSDGMGSLFPLEYPDYNIDQRDVEIWYQMQNYLNERY